MCFDHKPKTKACHAGEDVVLWCGEDVRCVLTKTKAGCLLPCKGGMWLCIGDGNMDSPLNLGVRRQMCFDQNKSGLPAAMLGGDVVVYLEMEV